MSKRAGNKKLVKLLSKLHLSNNHQLAKRDSKQKIGGGFIFCSLFYTYIRAKKEKEREKIGKRMVQKGNILRREGGRAIGKVRKILWGGGEDIWRLEI